MNLADVTAANPYMLFYRRRDDQAAAPPLPRIDPSPFSSAIPKQAAITKRRKQTSGTSVDCLNPMVLNGEVAVPRFLFRFFQPGLGLEYDEAAFARRMAGRDGARVGSIVGRIPYMNSSLYGGELRTLKYDAYVNSTVLDFLVFALQAENVELCTSRTAQFSKERPALGPSGPRDLGRVYVFSSSHTVPRAGSLWRYYHFVDLRLIDLVCCVVWLGTRHYAVFMLDLWARALHYYDSIKVPIARNEATAYAADILRWAETLGKLLNIPWLRDATTWPVHYYDDDASSGMPKQGRPTPASRSRPAVGWSWGSDCALFVCAAIACAARGEEFTFTQAHMPSLRRQAAYMIDNWWLVRGESVVIL